MLVARGHVPYETQPDATGKKDFSVDAALALAVSGELVARGARRSQAKEWVDAFLPLAIERAADPSTKTRASVWLGAAIAFDISSGEKGASDFERVVGRLGDIAEHVEQYQAALGPTAGVELIIVDVTACVRMMGIRAAHLRFNDPRLHQLSRWFR